MSRVTRHEMIAIRALQLSETTHRFCYRPMARADAYPMFEAGLDSDFHRYLDWAQASRREWGDGSARWFAVGRIAQHAGDVVHRGQTYRAVDGHVAVGSLSGRPCGGALASARALLHGGPGEILANSIGARAPSNDARIPVCIGRYPRQPHGILGAPARHEAGGAF